MLYESLLKLWWEEYRNSLLDTTRHHKEMEMRVHIIPELGNIQIKKINQKVIQQFINTKMQTVAPSSIKRFYNIINPSFRWAVEKKLMKYNPAENVTLPKVTPKEVETFSPDEIKCLIEAARPKWLGDIINLAYRTGMRRGEIYGLKKDDISFDDKFLMVRRTVSALQPGDFLVHHPKTKRSTRRISLDDTSTEILKKRTENSSSEWVFVNQYGNPISPWYNTKYMHDACVKAGIRPRCFHTLRHTHATVLLAKGVHPKIVQERLGHSNINMTLNIYSHVLPTMQGAAVDVFNKL
jgi:integrase|nr:MAG TPA: Integrase [Caudoviricetes sp.]